MRPINARFAMLLRSIGLAVLVVPSLMPERAMSAALPRIASMNVCTDRLLWPVADPEQIVGLSRFSRSAWLTKDPRPYPMLSGSAEDVLVLRPDVVIASMFDKRSTRELLKQHGLRLIELPVPRNL